MNQESHDNEGERQRDALRAEFKAARSEHLAGALAWGKYGLKLTSICERCPDTDCVDACAGSVGLEARLNGPKHLQRGITNEIRDLEKRLASHFEVEQQEYRAATSYE